MSFRDFFFLAIATLTLFLTACQQDIDKNDPVISDFTVDGDLADSVLIQAGNQVVFEAQLADDKELSQMRFSVEMDETKYFYPSGQPSLVEVTIIEAEEFDFEHAVLFPDTVPEGVWRAELSTFDGNGNRVDAGPKELYLINNELPRIEIDSIFPTLSSTSTTALSPNDTLDIYGNLSDGGALTEFVAELRSQEDNELVWSYTASIFGQTFLFQDLMELVVLPAEMEQEDFYLFFIARDNEDNVSRIRYSVNISE